MKMKGGGAHGSADCTRAESTSTQVEKDVVRKENEALMRPENRSTGSLLIAKQRGRAEIDQRGVWNA